MRSPLPFPGRAASRETLPLQIPVEIRAFRTCRGRRMIDTRFVGNRGFCEDRGMRTNPPRSDFPPPTFDEAEARARLWRPQVGMSVRYFHAAQPQLVDAALVTRVHSATSVNLCVFADGQPPQQVTQVSRRGLEMPGSDSWEPV